MNNAIIVWNAGTLHEIHANVELAMLKITSNIAIDENELEVTFIRAPGPGGQHVNKTATAVHLRFNVAASQSFSAVIRARLLDALKNRLTSQGDLIIKASRYRMQERNKQDAILRLVSLLRAVAVPRKQRKPTKPTKASKERRLKAKKKHAQIKSWRRSASGDASY